MFASQRVQRWHTAGSSYCRDKPNLGKQQPNLNVHPASTTATAQKAKSCQLQMLHLAAAHLQKKSGEGERFGSLKWARVILFVSRCRFFRRSTGTKPHGRDRFEPELILTHWTLENSRI